MGTQRSIVVLFFTEWMVISPFISFTLDSILSKPLPFFTLWTSNPLPSSLIEMRRVVEMDLKDTHKCVQKNRGADRRAWPSGKALAGSDRRRQSNSDHPSLQIAGFEGFLFFVNFWMKS